MHQTTQSNIVSFLWGIADDAMLEPAEQAVLEEKELLDAAGTTEHNFKIRADILAVQKEAEGLVDELASALHTSASGGSK
jgi:hypothetical protein